MPRVERVRTLLLSAPYGAASSRENVLHLPSGLRTSGFVEITLDDGTVGLGEGYLAVFAPHVFRTTADLLAQVVVGREIGGREGGRDAGRDGDRTEAILRDLVTASGYWSLQGAARHVISAFEIALLDCRARLAGVPVRVLLGGAPGEVRIPAYASGGDSAEPAAMAREIRQVAALGIGEFKIRARGHQTAKTIWTQRRAAPEGVRIAVDMTQNLVVPSQSPAEVLAFERTVTEGSGAAPVFLEEALGPDLVAELPELRRLTSAPLAGGEIVTTPQELRERVRRRCYDIVQPDATVVGGIGAVLDVFAEAADHATDVYVHCWGAGVGVAANYHAAAAAGGPRVEWPLPDYPLRTELLRGAVAITEGHALLRDVPGLGVGITPEIEREFAFREEAVYRCVVDPALAATDEDVWSVASRVRRPHHAAPRGV